MSIAADNLLIRAKTDVYHRLLGDEALASVSVLLDDEHSPAMRDQVKMGPKNRRGGKSGACVIVRAVGILGLDSGETPTPLMQMAIVCDVVEDVLINAGADGTGWNAGEIVARLVQTLHQSHYDERFTGLRLSASAPVVELEDEQPGRRGFMVTFAASQMQFDVVATCQSVSIADSSGTITLTCGTSGATIYYTTDGSYPGSGNAEATAYTTAFEVDAGTVIRAAAEKTGLNPSKYIAQAIAT
jgi:hypothetical protein